MESALSTFDEDFGNGGNARAIKTPKKKMMGQRSGYACVYLIAERIARANARAREVCDGNFSAYIGLLIDTDTYLDPSIMARAKQLAAARDVPIGKLLSDIVKKAITA